ncbi:hypothetical protein QTP88_010242 [Uroleucon formosanum]
MRKNVISVINVKLEQELCTLRAHKIAKKITVLEDRCQLSIRDAVYVLQATLEALNFNVEEYVINQTSIHRCREIYRRERSELIKLRFKESAPNYVVVHWDGELLPDTKMRNTTVERLPIVITSTNIEQIINVPQLERSTGKEQAAAVCNALQEWGLCDIVQALCCDTTASNTGRLNGACILIEQKTRSQYNISDLTKKAIGEICVFIIKFYVKAWFTCPLPNKSPNQNLQFIKDMKLYEVFDREISRVSIQKLCNLLWYLTEEAAALSFFDDSIPLEVKRQMVKALKKKRQNIRPND